MLKNYFNVAFRTLWKNKEFSLINLAGLALGISTCILITIYVLDELSYDKFHERASRITRLTPTLHMPKEDRPRAVTSPVMAPTLEANFPEIEKTVRITESSRILAYQDKKIYDTKILYADSTFFEIFTFSMIQGNPSTSLVNPYSVVLTERTAKKYFGDEDPFGQTMTLSDSISLVVTGLIQDIPSNSHLQFDVVLSRTTLSDIRNYQPETGWFSNDSYSYILTREGYDPSLLEAKFPAFLEKQMAEDKKDSGLWYDFYLQPITDIHLRSHLQAEMAPGGNIIYIYIFLGVGCLVLLIACANYINLVTARSLNRAKELGMRKVIGARRSQLVTQLLGESFVMVLMASVIAVAIISSVLPAFNLLTGKNIALGYFLHQDIMLIYVGILISISILGGAYPAVRMSSFSPMKTMNQLRHERSNGFLRKGLVIFQFTISIILIAGTIVIFRQMQFLQNQNLGLNKEQIIELRMRHSIIAKSQLIKNEILKIPGVLNVSATNFSYADGVNSVALLPEGARENEISSEPVISVDESFLETLDIELAAGRNFSKDFPTDEAEAFIINETAVKNFNWGTAERALGKNLDWGLGKKGKIIGVVKDFNFFSLRESVRPLVIHILPDWHNYLAVKVSPENLTQTIGNLEKTWKELNLDSPFDYSFMDKDFEKLYKAEAQTQTVIGFLSTFAIVIACLGLFGLAAFTAEQRTKEIGVRKVLGADIMSVVALLSNDFIKPVILSIVIAIPFAWYGINLWLQSFAYRTELNGWIFVLAGTIAIVIALFTVSFQSIKAATANPIESLRSE